MYVYMQVADELSTPKVKREPDTPLSLMLTRHPDTRFAAAVVKLWENRAPHVMIPDPINTHVELAGLLASVGRQYPGAQRSAMQSCADRTADIVDGRLAFTVQEAQEYARLTGGPAGVGWPKGPGPRGHSPLSASCGV